MTNRIEIAGLRVAGELFTFVGDEALPGTGISELDFWHRFADIVNDLAPKNRALLARRDELQAKLDDWYRDERRPHRHGRLQGLPHRRSAISCPRARTSR